MQVPFELLLLKTQQQVKTYRPCSSKERLDRSRLLLIRQSTIEPERLDFQLRHTRILRKKKKESEFNHIKNLLFWNLQYLDEKSPIAKLSGIPILESESGWASGDSPVMESEEIKEFPDCLVNTVYIYELSGDFRAIKSQCIVLQSWVWLLSHLHFSWATTVERAFWPRQCLRMTHTLILRPAVA